MVYFPSCLRVSVDCGAQASFRQPDLERVVCFILGTRQPAGPVSMRCCAVPVLRMCSYVMMLWRMRDCVLSFLCVSVVCGAQVSSRQSDIERVIVFICGTRQPAVAVRMRFPVLSYCVYVW